MLIVLLTHAFYFLFIFILFMIIVFMFNFVLDFSSQVIFLKVKKDKWKLHGV